MPASHDETGRPLSQDGRQPAASPTTNGDSGRQHPTKRVCARVPKEVHDAIALRKIITGKTIAEIVGEILTREMQKDIASLRLLSNANVVMRPDDVEGQRIS